MRTSVAEVNQNQGSCSSSGQCYQTVAQCNVSTISSKLDGNQTLKVWAPSVCVCVCVLVWEQHQPVLFLSQSGTLKSRNGSEWRAYCNLNDIGQSVILSVAVKYPARAECCAALHLQGQRGTCHLHQHHTGSSLGASSLLGMKMKQGFLVKANPLLWFW